ncbi:MAG: hypothetical protein U0X91_24720 [Spirosomataceae bacterium]
MPIRRFSSWFLLVILAIIISYYVLFPHIWRCQWIAYSDFKKVTPTLYISPELSAKHLQSARRAMAEARRRIAKLWGTPAGEAIFILCEHTEEYRRYCNSGEGAGCSIGTPWGASYIILNPDGLNTDVIAHEMCHDELFTRLGWWTTTRQIPQWFNEGLALMADHRFVAASDSIQRYLDYKEECAYVSNGGQIVLSLDEISSLHGFFNGNNGHVMLAYMTSGMEVSRWLANTGTQHVPGLINRIKSGETFEKAYQSLDQKKYQK